MIRRSYMFRIILPSAIVLCATCIATAEGVSQEWRSRVESINWICYTPTECNPDAGQPTNAAAIKADLQVLRKAGFDGLITYGSSGLFGREIVPQAEAAGFKGLIIGVWDPRSADELTRAVAVAKSPLVLGVCVGNEGRNHRYSPAELRLAIADVRKRTGKPVTTTEEIDDYVDADLLATGDWLFPNSHPFFHGRRDWKTAVRWTKGAYDDLRMRGDRFVWFKEIGLPTGGDPKSMVSEAAQERYYFELGKLPVMYAYFEAFDQPWKNWAPFETQWGLFTSDRQPKRLAQHFISKGIAPPLAARDIDESATSDVIRAKPSQPFYVYGDAGDQRNHFRPTGLDGDCGDISIDEAHANDVYRGKTCIRVAYTAAGRGPNKCNYGPPCGWAALCWLHPPENWGDKAKYADTGFDLRGYTKLAFTARAERPCRIRFLVGGKDGPYGDSLAYPRNLVVTLGTTWQEYEINLRGADLRYIISGFGWDAARELNPDGAVFYLDEIRFE